MKEGTSACYVRSRLFLGGVVEPLTVDNLRSYLSQFGEIESCVIMIHPVTKTSKGFGFVTYRKLRDTDRALNSAPYHIVDGVRFEIKKCQSKEDSEILEQIVAPRKLYIENVPVDAEKEDLCKFFSKYGEVEELFMMHKEKERHQRFAFIVFKEEEVAKLVLNYQSILYKGTILHIRKAHLKRDARIYKMQEMGISPESFTYAIKKSTKTKMKRTSDKIVTNTRNSAINIPLAKEFKRIPAKNYVSIKNFNDVQLAYNHGEYRTMFIGQQNNEVDQQNNVAYMNTSSSQGLEDLKSKRGFKKNLEKNNIIFSDTRKIYCKAYRKSDSTLGTPEYMSVANLQENFDLVGSAESLIPLTEPTQQKAHIIKFTERVYDTCTRVQKNNSVVYLDDSNYRFNAQNPNYLYTPKLQKR